METLKEARVNDPKTARPSNQHLLAYALIALGAIVLLTRLGGADWLWLALLSVAFLLGYVSRKRYGFLVAGGVLMGVAVGTLIDTQSGMLLSLAAGFFAIDRIEPKPNRWALYTAGILAVLGGLSALSATGLLGSVGFALALIAFGGYLLLRDRQETRFPPQDTYVPTAPAAPQAPAPTTAPTPTPEVSVIPQPGTAQVVTAEPGVTPATPAPTHAKVKPAPDVAPELGPEAEARLRRLEAWRRETASAEGVPAYIVFSNDTLARIAAAEPRTLEELGGVKGVGPVKLERYGQAVLGVVRGDPAAPTG